MDQSTAPWRALEEDAASGGGASTTGAAADPARSGAARSTWIVAAFGAAALVAGAAIWLVATNGGGTVIVEGDGPGPARSGQPVIAGRSSTAPATGGDLVVDVQGAVVRPGIVHLPGGSRVADAIAAAGGYGPRVAADRVGQALNLAALVKDGDQVIVPSRDDRPASGATASGSLTGTGGNGGNGGPVDLNHATAAELDELPGIGPVTAAKIVAARDEQAFASVDDLRTRKILGAATFDKVKDLVVVR
jgi:competence protein ComEA